MGGGGRCLRQDILDRLEIAIDRVRNTKQGKYQEESEGRAYLDVGEGHEDFIQVSVYCAPCLGRDVCYLDDHLLCAYHMIHLEKS